MPSRCLLSKWRWVLASPWMVAFICFFSISAQADTLKIDTGSAVDEQGAVHLTLTLENTGATPLRHVHPMFHFHHSSSMLPPVAALAPGERVTMETNDHPPVVRHGRYPVAAMVHYRDENGEERTALHTDSFHYREPAVSEIVGEIQAARVGEDSLLRVILKNHSASLKNIQMMLLVPPELIVENFKGMMGLTLRGGEVKQFEVPVKRAPGSRDGDYPVHLTVEYGEMLTHFTGEIKAKVRVGSLWVSLAPHAAAVVLLVLFTFFLYRRSIGPEAAAAGG